MKRQYLIEQVRTAVQKKELPPRFTKADFLAWTKQKTLAKRDGKPYAKSSIQVALHNASDHKAKTTLNTIVLKEIHTKDGVFYEFIP